MAFTYPQRVRFQHRDPVGIVFFPRYFEMVNATVEEWFATRLDLPVSEMHGPARGGVPTATIRADFPAPSRLGEMLDWTLVPLRLGRSSCELWLRASCAGQPRVEFFQTLVWIDMDSRHSQQWPEKLRAKIEQDIDTEGKRHDRDNPAGMEGAQGLCQRHARRRRAALYRRPDRLERRPGVRDP